METEGTLPCSQEPTTGPYPKLCSVAQCITSLKTVFFYCQLLTLRSIPKMEGATEISLSR